MRPMKAILIKHKNWKYKFNINYGLVFKCKGRVKKTCKCEHCFCSFYHTASCRLEAHFTALFFFFFFYCQAICRAREKFPGEYSCNQALCESADTVFVMERISCQSLKPAGLISESGAAACGGLGSGLWPPLTKSHWLILWRGSVSPFSFTLWLKS